MFSIVPADEAKTASLLQREKITDADAMVLTVDGEEIGYALYCVSRDTVDILCLRAPEGEWEEWLVRAVLNAAVNRNAITALCREPLLFPLLKRLGFAVSEAGCEVFIPEFFTRPCHDG